MFCCRVRNGNWRNKEVCRRKGTLSWPGAVLDLGCSIGEEKPWLVDAWGLTNKKPVMIAQTPGLEVVEGTEKLHTDLGILGKEKRKK